MAAPNRSSREWVQRVRMVQKRAVRKEEGVCFVEGIRQVIAAREGGWPLEVLLVDPARLRSDVAWQEIDRIAAPVVELSTRDFERISSRDNPTGIAAIVKWRPLDIDLLPANGNLYVVTDEISDAGNLGTLMRTCDAFGVAGLIVHGGVDPAHQTCLRSSLGTAFRLPVASVETLDDAFRWCAALGIKTVATSARAEASLPHSGIGSETAAIVLGNEGRGLAPETIARCDTTIRIPMAGTATSLNVGVAAGILLYEATRNSL